MRITNVIKVMKKVNPEKVLLLKVGNFYYQYGRDSYIMGYTFGYKVKIIENAIPFSSFPKEALNKVITKLEDNKISYIIIDKSQNYEVLEEQNYKRENNYLNCYDKSHEYIKKRNRIDNIYKELIKNIKEETIKEKIKQIEEIIYEI